jgi:hypothetical protein
MLEDVGQVEGLYEHEQFWIDYFRNMGCPLTNDTDGGPGTQGFHHLEATKEKIRQALTGRNRPALDVEARVVRSRRIGGRPFVDQTGRRYETIMDAVRSLGVNQGHVWAVLHGREPSTRGFAFRYVELEAS